MTTNFINQINHQFIKQYPISIYVHWPFCLSKCPYCDFNSHVSQNIDHEDWANQYLQELELFLPYFRDRTIKSIYFGGGTPSLMEPSTTKAIIDFLRAHGIFSENIEITLEANPTSIEYAKFQKFREAGVNRVSIGMQALNDKDLKFLGRNHNCDDGIEAIKFAKEIFPRYSFDLIYSRPEQTLDGWQYELNRAIEMADDHISLYQLTIEKGTKFFQMYKNDAFKMPNDELSNDFYFLTDEILSKNGFFSYEVSNYAKNDKYSKHNMCYWQYDDYLGIGPGAHSRLRNDFLHHYSFYMSYSPHNWMSNMKNNGNAIQNLTLLTTKEVIEEMILTGLRIKNGISHDKSIEKLGEKIASFFDQKAIDFLMNEDLILIDDEKFSTTAKGFRFIDFIYKRLLRDIKPIAFSQIS